MDETYFYWRIGPRPLAHTRFTHNTVFGPEVNSGCCDTAFHLSLSCNLICLERESATSGDDNYPHQSPEHALWLKVRRSASSRKSRAGNDGRRTAAFFRWQDRHGGNPVFGARHGQFRTWRCVLTWQCSNSACAFTCVHMCANRKSEWPACANERWREAVIETQGRIGDGYGCGVCSCIAQGNKKHKLPHSFISPPCSQAACSLWRRGPRGGHSLSVVTIHVCALTKQNTLWGPSKWTVWRWQSRFASVCSLQGSKWTLTLDASCPISIPSFMCHSCNDWGDVMCCNGRL